MQNYLTFAFVLLGVAGMTAQVGINTSNPQQDLHIAGNDATLRVEGLNSTNNSYNGGDVNGDLDLTNDTFPLYVDQAGVFTLEPNFFENSEDIDAIDDSCISTNTVTLPISDADGQASTAIYTYTITVPRETILEVHYRISFDIYANSSYTVLSDNFARRVSTFLTVTGQLREYGIVSKCYSSGVVASQFGHMYNSANTYITLPSAGTYTITLNGEISTDLTAGVGNPSRATYAEFATGDDMIFIRAY